MLYNEILRFLSENNRENTIFFFTVCNKRTFYEFSVIALNAIWPNILGAKLCFHPIVYLLNTLDKTNLTPNG